MVKGFSPCVPGKEATGSQIHILLRLQDEFQTWAKNFLIVFLKMRDGNRMQWYNTSMASVRCKSIHKEAGPKPQNWGCQIGNWKVKLLFFWIVFSEESWLLRAPCTPRRGTGAWGARVTLLMFLSSLFLLGHFLTRITQEKDINIAEV